jgi:hypothetical protein
VYAKENPFAIRAPKLTMTMIPLSFSAAKKLDNLSFNYKPIKANAPELRKDITIELVTIPVIEPWRTASTNFSKVFFI